MVLDLAKLCKNPSFYKLLIKFMNGIVIPSSFIKEHKKMLAKTCLLKTDEGMLWEAKIVRQRSNFFICEGDWPQFVVYHKLEVGDVLVFFLIDKSTFQVLPCTQKGCRNLPEEQLLEELSSSSEEEEEEEEEEEGEEGGGGEEEEEEEEEEEAKEEAEEEAEVEEDVEVEVEEKPDIRASSKGKRVEVVSVVSSDCDNDSIDPSSGSEGSEVEEHEEEEEEEETHFRVSQKWKRRKLMAIISSPSKDVKMNFGAKRRKMNFGAKRKRALKDPDKPKRPLSAFMVFMEEFRKKFKEENPSNKSVTVVGRAAGEKWKQLSDADKAPFVAEADKRMAEYQKNMNVYKEVAYQKGIDVLNKLRGLAPDPDKPNMP